MRPVRAIVIDPFKCEVVEVELDADDYTAIYPLLSHESMPVSTFEIATRLDRIGAEGDVIFVDEEFLLKPCHRWFVFEGAHQAFGGKGLIVGGDAHGETQAAKISVETVREHVRFLRPLYHLLVETRTPWEPEPPIT